MKTILFLVPKMSGPNGDFVYASNWDESMQRSVCRRQWRVITPSTLLLAAIAKNDEFIVDISDEEFREVSLENQYDIVCIYTVTPNAKRAYYYADQFRMRGSHVVIGGVHAMFLPDEAAEHGDTLLLGEAEYIFKQFLSDFRSGHIKKRYTQPCGTVNIQDSPLPLYEALNQDEQQLVPLQTARGCPRQCRFCSTVSLYGKQFRPKSDKQLHRELEVITRLPHTKTLYVTNDNLMSDNIHYQSLCQIMKQYPFRWYTNADISFGEKESVINTAYQSGLRQVLIGLESIESNDLRDMDPSSFKFKYRKHYTEHIQRIQSNGIGVVGSFIVGKSTDTPETFKRLWDFIYDSGLYGVSVTVCTPYPGTFLFEQLKSEAKILSYDWNRYTIFEPVIKPEQLTVEQVEKLYHELLGNLHSAEYINHKTRLFLDNRKKYRQL